MPHSHSQSACLAGVQINSECFSGMFFSAILMRIQWRNEDSKLWSQGSGRQSCSMIQLCRVISRDSALLVRLCSHYKHHCSVQIFAQITLFFLLLTFINTSDMWLNLMWKHVSSVAAHHGFFVCLFVLHKTSAAPPKTKISYLWNISWFYDQHKQCTTR